MQLPRGPPSNSHPPPSPPITPPPAPRPPLRSPSSALILPTAVLLAVKSTTITYHYRASAENKQFSHFALDVGVVALISSANKPFASPFIVASPTLGNDEGGNTALVSARVAGADRAGSVGGAYKLNMSTSSETAFLALKVRT